MLQHALSLNQHYISNLTLSDVTCWKVPLTILSVPVLSTSQDVRAQWCCRPSTLCVCVYFPPPAQQEVMKRYTSCHTNRTNGPHLHPVILHPNTQSHTHLMLVTNASAYANVCLLKTDIPASYDNAHSPATHTHTHCSHE